MTHRRETPVDLSPDEFRALGHELVERLATYFEGLRSRSIVPVPIADVRRQVRDISWRAEGEELDTIAASAASLLLDQSVITGHPRFWGYINGAASPLAALADLLATSANPNSSAWYVGPASSAIEEQVVSWLAELVGFSSDCGGLLVSGGSMANIIALATARTRLGGALRVYATRETHTWLAKARDLLGLGGDAVTWVPHDGAGRLSVPELVARAPATGQRVVVVANAGTTSTGAIDPIDELANLCTERGWWLHIDGAYGAPAACVADAPRDLRALGRARSLVLDPHKWLYTSLEAGCVLVRDRQDLTDTFAQGASYYGGATDMLPPHFRDLGPQTSRGARAVKVWMCMRRAGRAGYAAMISDDIALARYLFERVGAHSNLQPFTTSLSITTFRYIPSRSDIDVDELNREIVRRLQEGGQVYPSSTVVDGLVAIRVCIVNFRTTRDDIDELVRLVVETGDQLSNHPPG